MLFPYASCLAGNKLVPKMTKNTALPKNHLGWRCQYHQHLKRNLFAYLLLPNEITTHNNFMQKKLKYQLMQKGVFAMLLKLIP
jgi:hypothetical protein